MGSFIAGSQSGGITTEGVTGVDVAKPPGWGSNGPIVEGDTERVVLVAAQADVGFGIAQIGIADTTPMAILAIEIMNGAVRQKR
jgi:hypothetical protein